MREGSLRPEYCSPRVTRNPCLEPLHSSPLSTAYGGLERHAKLLRARPVLLALSQVSTACRGHPGLLFSCSTQSSAFDVCASSSQYGVLGLASIDFGQAQEEARSAPRPSGQSRLRETCNTAQGSFISSYSGGEASTNQAINHLLTQSVRRRMLPSTSSSARVMPRTCKTPHDPDSACCTTPLRVANFLPHAEFGHLYAFSPLVPFAPAYV